ncbi:MAG: 50S ribosomal protein L29 [Candidatus Doudnabacteria bacterium RIFCSPLOWO2_02_FULL_49_13]|uniref:Large ribosomal subunit protein uL29 n=1 Tax=Candidatus Doudnabacteria bacterium RIFCSPHIGHO2_12_FULL_48_16 TaxID=1817838 RepID=A0A1F5PJ83_9BACT|nr:MAG: 50S ribosomal protein L29 [Candidatus Doudnabacteria bacterium RIFCSPHIGHO2_02_FULL_49_24]OGE88134.1 MAG: 50S ribosomal protein L29 [Candidatus Doudnabacteria bacterium RIFCSPHIGHO2_01_FULL_50_67]OGE90005.1 MAG: 50S ribosomal protein L29 [Candidatus Doudnabacteria bacterium RIFCSPHIGHO2_12_FULL_48_16]OGE96578.1 MAG: 50S ribosomal protein L29 [Candidatus Doudnabacteria bacterium RIFCSPLOWO2_01_FULL_49_40]OGF03148.1 MAG: 50S ribosomal protein L29 [Candidatus Doudnabacteria bacterium RIFCS
MKMKELQAMGEQELGRQLASLREQVRDLTFKIHSKEVKNSHTLQNIKKDIARILTLINSK